MAPVACGICRGCSALKVPCKIRLYKNSGSEVGIRAKLQPNLGPTFGPEFGCAFWDGWNNSTFETQNSKCYLQV